MRRVGGRQTSPGLQLEVSFFGNFFACHKEFVLAVPVKHWTEVPEQHLQKLRDQIEAGRLIGN